MLLYIKFLKDFVMEPNDRLRQHLDYPEATMFEMVARVAKQYPEEPAYEFYSRKTTYAQFIRRIERAARALWAFGVRPGDAVTICLPNIPQALDCFYAVNRLGAVANMVQRPCPNRSRSWNCNWSWN